MAIILVTFWKRIGSARCCSKNGTYNRGLTFSRQMREENTKIERVENIMINKNKREIRQMNKMVTGR